MHDCEWCLVYLHSANAADDTTEQDNPLTPAHQSEDDKAAKIDTVIEGSVIENTKI